MEEAYNLMTTKSIQSRGQSIEKTHLNGTLGTCSGSAVSSGRDSCVDIKNGVCQLYKQYGSDLGQCPVSRWHKLEDLGKISPAGAYLNIPEDRAEVCQVEQGTPGSGDEASCRHF